jgi:dolichol-phosphate mannosyltransferase
MIGKFFKFGSVGLLGSITNLSIFSILVFWEINYNVASCVAFLVAVSQNYLLNKSWTFKDHYSQTDKQFIKYFILNFSSFLINLAVLNVIVFSFGEAKIIKIIAQALGIVVAMGFNFLGSYLIVFAKSERMANE